MPQIKMIGLDLDGTLLNTKKRTHRKYQARSQGSY